MRGIYLFQHKRFSLVELLVVIAILAVIMSLLSPALNSVIKQANLVQCGSNLRNVGIGIKDLAYDNDLAFLDETHLFQKSSSGYFRYSNPMMRRSFKGYPQTLKPYITNLHELIYCPEDQSEDAINNSSNGGAHVSYEFKSILISLSRSNYKRSIKESDFNIPERQSLLINRKTFHSQYRIGGGRSDLMIYHHNFYFVDGHIELYNTGYNHPNYLGIKNVSWQKYPEQKEGDGAYLDVWYEPEDNFL